MRGRMRPIRRPMRPGVPSQVGSRAQKALQRAHQLMETGNHAQAAQIFERLAQGARDLGRLKIAPNLFLQAGRAYLLTGNQEDGKNCIYSGLELIARAQKWPVLATIGQRTISELTTLGFPQLSDQVSDWVKEKLPEPIESYPQPGHTSKPMPLKCPSCGGALRPGEIEMLDSITGECPYCGSAIRGE